MKRITSLLLAALLGTATHAQYFGTTVFVEGFDSETFPAAWTQENAAPDDPTRWATAENKTAPFSSIDASSTYSAQLNIKSKETKLTLTSPEISLPGKSGLQIGFYGYELSYCMRGKVDFRFRVTKDNGATWTNLFDALRGDSYTGEAVGRWNLYKYALPEEFDGATIRMQFYTDASTATNPGGLAGYIDGLFISERLAIDPQITGTNYSTDNKRPTTGAYGQEEPLTIRFANNGTQALGSVELYYQINDGPEIAETFVPEQPIPAGQTAQYAFAHKADLSEPLAFFSIKAGIRTEGDGNPDNNELTVYAENITAGVPYIPRFMVTEDGITVTSEDEWTTTENNPEAYWDYDDWDTFYWYIEPEWAEKDCDAYLLSRPVWLEAGKTYSLSFNAYEMEEGDGANKMAVLVTGDKTLESGMTEIWRNESIDEENALEQSARYTATFTGIHYFVFHCFSSPGAGAMGLDNISLYNNVTTDAGIIKILSPVNNQYLFGASEKVQVLLQNTGMSNIASGQLQVNMRLNDGATVSETITEALVPNQQLTYTFDRTLDLSDTNSQHLLSVWTSLPGDEDASNDRITIDYTSTVAGIPYLPDFGTMSQRSKELSFWTTDDRNNDGYTFAPYSESALSTYVFSYGGGMMGWSIVTIPQSDDGLYSRPVALKGGESYKLSFLSKVGKADAGMPLSINLYKVENQLRTFVGNVWNGTVSTPDYIETASTVAIGETGIYELEFRVTHQEPVDFRIYLGKFRLTQVYDIDLSLEEIVVPTTKISCYNIFPIGAMLKNEGTSPITSFTLKASSPSAGETSRTYTNILLEPNGTYLVYLDKDICFNGADDETLTLSVETEADGYEGNNRQAIGLTYISPRNVPYAPNPSTDIDEWTLINENKDACRFVPVRNLGTGFLYTGDSSVEADDWIATPCLALQKESVYSIDFSFYVLPGDTTTFDVFAYEAGSGTRVRIAHIEGATQSLTTQYLGYFSVPADGNYNICFQPTGHAPSLFISASPKIDRATGRPDICLLAITAPEDDGVYSADETLTATFKNNGNVPLAFIPFTCQVNGKEYRASYNKYVPADEDIFTAEVKGIDLYTPGEYNVRITADVTEDSTPADNSLTATFSSLPVIDAAITGLESPGSGLLGKEEPVILSVRNAGKGTLTGIPVRCTITTDDQTYSKTLTGTIEDPIAEGETKTYTFDETADLYRENVYRIVVSIDPEGDIDTSNNRLETSVTSTHRDFDAGVTDVLTPTDAILTQSETVSIAVSNYSEVDLFDVPVTVEVTHEAGTGSDAQVLTGIVPEIKAASSVAYTLPGSVSMKPTGNYRIKAYTQVGNDVNPSNDACTVTVRCLKQDVGVTAILSPESGEELGMQEVTIEVRNFGEAAVGRIPVKYQIGTMPQLGIIEETIQPDETLVYTFPARYEFAAYKRYTVIAATELEEDAEPENDSCTKEIENAQPNSIGQVSVNSISLYPNPSSGKVHVTAKDTLRTIWICDLQGNLLKRYDNIGTTVFSMELPLATGHYIVRIQTPEGTSNHKLTIER